MTPPPGATALDPAQLSATIREQFRPHGGIPRVGLEVEALPVDAATLRPVAPESPHGHVRAVAPALARWAGTRGWTAGRSAAGAPTFRGPEGGTLSFEPGGQLEYASPPHASLDHLTADVESVLRSVADALASDGIRLVARGVDPWNPLSGAPLHVEGDRYRRMAAHYARRGPWGGRMMRQTAGLHVNVDAPGPPGEAWWVANAAVPALVAAFANSPRIESREAGARSARAAQWRRLDPSRTGLPGGGDDPVADYLAFALGADAFLLGPEAEAAAPFRTRLAEASPGDWSRHLTTLFPEVRPRGYLEIRSVDALPLSLVPLPAAVAAGLLFDDATRTLARATLPWPDPDLLERAGQAGLGDPTVADLVDRVFDLATRGLGRLGGAVAGPRLRALLEDFRTGFVAPRLDPGTRPGDDLVDDPST